MSKIPYFPFYPADWVSSQKILLMSWEQRGIYIHLLSHCWMNPGCSLPTEKEKLQRLCPGARWSNIEYVIREAFETIGEGHANPRLRVEHSKAIAKSEKARDSINYRWNKENQKTDVLRTNNERNTNQNQNHIHNHIEEEAGEVPERPSPEKPVVKSSRRQPGKRKADMTDEEWLLMVKANPAYSGLDVDLVQAKLIAWCATKGRKPTRSRLLNWLNREEKPITGGISNANKPDRRSFFERDVDQREQAKRGARTLLGVLGGGSGLVADADKAKADGKGISAIPGEVEHVPEVETAKA